MQLVTPAYAIETGTFTLAPFQTITAEGIKLNTPPGTELEDPEKYNGHARIFAPDGRKLIPNPAKDFQGLLFVDVSAFHFTPKEFSLIISQIDLDECHLTKALADFVSTYNAAAENLTDMIRAVIT